MGTEARPPGRSFRERWPHDAATADWFARPWIPIALGAMASLVALPLYIAIWFQVSPWLWVAGLALSVALAVPARRSALAATVWRWVTWILLAGTAGLGLAVAGGWLAETLCGPDGCGPIPQDPGGTTAGALLFLMIVLVSVGLAVFVDRVARSRFATRGRAR